MSVEKILPLPAYQELNAQLYQALGNTINACEVHGIICAFICAGHKMNGRSWLEALLGVLDTPQQVDEKVSRDIFITLYEISCQQLKDNMLEFQLLLPDDEECINLRIESLGLWCQGFLCGLGLAGIQLEDFDDNEELSEIVADLSEIAKVDHTMLEGSEDDEVSYTEVLEYLRMAVILLYGEFEVWQSENEENTPIRLH
ncbi:MAG: UPF0149 family protein [Legionellales bacterium]|nr:UPF0149 family protein [Legionellales bacterium]